MSDTRPKPTVPRHKKPADLSEIEWQRELRKQFVYSADNAAFTIKYLDGEHPVFADYSVANPASGGVYRVALRSSQPGPNFCTCPDFKTNLLGTCKHIEAILRHVRENKKLAKLQGDNFRPAYSSVYLKYGQTREVMLRIGENQPEKYRQLAKSYFDEQGVLLPGSYDRVDQLLAEAARISPDFRCYPDVMDFIIAKREARARRALIDRKVDEEYLDELLNTPLYAYQKEGITFAARAGRCLIADDMGLGKTIQAIGCAELLKKECGVTSVLIVCPTSLKYQWKSEIEKFTGSGAVVIEGDALKRQALYDTPDAYYKIASYTAVGYDLAQIQKFSPDLVILDEAQRIKNWQTKTARQVKKIESTYAIVLTGTPIENKLEELYSIIQFIDPFKLGPLYHFLSEHQIHDEFGKVIGYHDLNQIRNLLSDIVIRRTKKSVLSQLPGRTDKHIFVPLTKEQAELHAEYNDMVAKLASKWKRLGYLDEKDRQRLMLALSCMRMVSDSTYILDQETRFDTKISELMSILDTIFDANEEKVVVFSQWERMTRLVRAELDDRQVGYAYLHGGIPSRKRGALLDDFREDSSCRVFLSTDAGGVGLNLQSASLVINLDIPWNPAILEQRIGRIYRHGQKRKVNVINLVSKGSIEERLLDVLAFKSSLFAGVLDDGSDQIFMGESKFKQFMLSVEEVAVTPAEPVSATDTEEIDQEETATRPVATTPSESTAQFINSAGAFFDSLARTLADKQSTEQLISTLVEKDQVTGKTYLKIPVENERIVTTALEALTGLLSALKK